MEFLLLVFWHMFSMHAEGFPSDLSIYEFGTREHANGGIRWDDRRQHPSPYKEPVKATKASLFQYLPPDPMPTAPKEPVHLVLEYECEGMGLAANHFHEALSQPEY